MDRRHAAMRLALVVFCLGFISGPAYGSEPPNDSGSPLARAFAKALAFETLSSVGETVVFIAFYGAGASISGPAVFAVSLTSATAVYVAHELAWNANLPDELPEDDAWVIGGKAATYRVVSALRSFAVGNAFGAPGLGSSAAFAASVALADTALYVANELVFSWMGPPVAKAAER